jgi:hypothetical protein
MRSVSFASNPDADGVGHGAQAIAAVARSLVQPFRSASFSAPSFVRTLLSHAFGVGHEVKPVPPVRRTDAASRKIDRPDGVTDVVQVIENKVEPNKRVVRRSLLAKDDIRTALRYEVKPERPEVPLVSKPLSAACRGERLARA